MDKVREQLEQMSDELQKAIDFVKKQCVNEPDGVLRISKRKDGFVRYYQKYNDKISGKTIEQYLSQKKRNLIEQLAQKQYQNSLVLALEEELHNLKKIQKLYKPEKRYEIYDMLSEERKKLVQPVFLSAEEKFQRWKQQEYKRYEGYQEGLHYETERGELVRSKSELIIANLLNKEQEHLHYRYEQELYLKQSHITIHPDFTIMSRKTAKIIYWEHAGMMSDPEYADEFVQKINSYIKEGYVLGKDFIITCETENTPLDITVVRKIIKECI